MANFSSGQLDVLPISDNPLFEQRERDLHHTPYLAEIRFFSCIEQGDCEALTAATADLAAQRVVVGRLSADPVRQMQYWAICCITLATRYAIQGGLDETDAYNFSDYCIGEIDTMANVDAMLDYLLQKSMELTGLVARSKMSGSYPSEIRRCIRFVKQNLHQKLTVSLLAEQVGLSADYLSHQFYHLTGMRLSEYVRREKLLAAQQLLKKGFSLQETACYLSFSSESYFIRCFREMFGMTPGEYLKQCGY